MMIKISGFERIYYSGNKRQINDLIKVSADIISNCCGNVKGGIAARFSQDTFVVIAKTPDVNTLKNNIIKSLNSVMPNVSFDFYISDNSSSEQDFKQDFLMLLDKINS